MKVFLAVSATYVASATAGGPFANMNGEYKLSPTGDNTEPPTFPTNFSDYPGGVEYFDVYHGPINHTYSQVFWRPMINDLPQEIVERFKGKTMAIVGIEIDQVMRQKDNNTGQLVDVSVPISFVYNHHHDSSIVGSGASLEITDRNDPRVGVNGEINYMRLDKGKVWLPVDSATDAAVKSPAAKTALTAERALKGASSFTFSDANGGEYRKSYHGVAPPFAFLVESPEKMGGAPMHIDTWNRDEMRLPTIQDPTPPKFVPGPYPKNQVAPLSGVDAIYSGLLECPLTTRIERVFDPGCEDFNDSIAVQIRAPVCQNDILPGPDDCFEAVKRLPELEGSSSFQTRTVNSASLPQGCLVHVDASAGSGSAVTATFNTHAGNQTVTFDTVPGMISAHSPDFVKSMAGATREQALAACEADVKCDAVTVNDNGGKAGPTAKLQYWLTSRTVVKQEDSYTSFVKSIAGVGCDQGAPNGVVGSFSSNETAVEVDIAVNASTATLTLSGPSDVWFGVGFGAKLMSDQPYAITVAPSSDSDGSVVTERKLANHAAGTVLNPSVTVVSDTVAGGVRTVAVTRPVYGASNDYYSFDNRALELDIIQAVGSTPSFSIHRASGAASVRLWPSGTVEDAFACVCKTPPAPFGQGSGGLRYLDTGEVIGFAAGRCAEQPREDILAQRNPTCDLRTYQGGLSVCHDKWFLLDADQELPWQDQPLVYYKKYRVYFQDYNATGGTNNGPSHISAYRSDWGIAADGDHAEYDVPISPPGTAPENRTHLITGTWQVVDRPNTFLAAIHFHCHAPTCLRMELWNNDTGELLCRQEPLYGGTGAIDRPEFDEPGYIATPPCLWGNPADGLQEPPNVSFATLRVTALTNSTYAHRGEMALPQATLVSGPFPWNTE